MTKSRKNLISQIKNEILIDRLHEANKQALQANKAKNIFLANMSHEIRTPMNGILGMTKLAIDIHSGQEQKKILGNVLYSAEILLGIINDILDFSKIEAGKLHLEPHDFSLPTMLFHSLTP